MAFVYYDQIIAHLTQIYSLSRHHAVASDKDASPFAKGSHLVLSIGLLFVIKLHYIIDIGAPLFELTLPIHFHCSWRHNEDLRDCLSMEQAFA